MEQDAAIGCTTPHALDRRAAQLCNLAYRCTRPRGGATLEDHVTRSWARAQRNGCGTPALVPSSAGSRSTRTPSAWRSRAGSRDIDERCRFPTISRAWGPRSRGEPYRRRRDHGRQTMRTRQSHETRGACTTRCRMPSRRVHDRHLVHGHEDRRDRRPPWHQPFAREPDPDRGDAPPARTARPGGRGHPSLTRGLAGPGEAALVGEDHRLDPVADLELRRGRASGVS